MFGFLSPILIIISQAHVFVLWGAGIVDFKIRLIIVLAVLVISVTFVKFLTSASRTLTKIDKSSGALGYLVAVIPAFGIGYAYAQTLPDPAPIMIDVLEMANLTYDKGIHRLINDPNAPVSSRVGAFESGQSSRLPQINSTTGN
ncbi:MAG: hypothetical protein AAF826_07955 [Pseudomonadota bacterium]